MKTLIFKEEYFVNVRMDDVTYNKLVRLYTDVFFNGQNVNEEKFIKHMHEKLNTNLDDVLFNASSTYMNDYNEVMKEIDYFPLMNENSVSYDDDIFIHCTVKHFDGENVTIDIKDVTLGNRGTENE